MKNMVKLFGVIAFVAAIGFGMTACGDDPDDSNGDPTSITYTSYDAQGNKYELVINKYPNRAVYTPQTGDSFTLTVKNPAGTVIASSTGTVTVNGNNFTLAQNGGSTITITVTSGGAIGTISGTIPGAGGNGAITDPVVTPNNQNNGNNSNPFKGRWTGTATTPGGAATFTLVFDNTTFENTLIFDSWSVKQRGEYTFTGNTFSGTCTSVNYGEDDEDTGWVDSGEFFETYSGNPWSGSISGGILTASAGGVSFTSN